MDRLVLVRLMRYGNLFLLSFRRIYWVSEIFFGEFIDLNGMKVCEMALMELVNFSRKIL